MKHEQENAKNQAPSFAQAKRRLRWKRLFARKWFLPAVYLSIVALIVAVTWWYQGYQMRDVHKHQSTMDTLLHEEETDRDIMGMPVMTSSMAVKTKDFYQEQASKQDRESALVKYANTFWPHSGIDFARKDGEVFTVIAALDGVVRRVEDNPVVGKQIEIEHDNGMVTVYQSLGEVSVKAGQVIKKGDQIGTAGQNQFEKENGNHIHFEVLKEKKHLNPEQYLSQASK
ncbi:stage II sporulation protein Q [Seinonella peptonophila]|uniref:Stage II sporulation protein Q n=1 Tax=Seinonella peptonophila TaxID=112248 RepID=A0A1M4XSM1_9BACL|nr:M23 family metallopeptidase [Seinonella peptonophila]SHE96471.1 stage II sporulation protein Q [Seinonella peptonophila]